MNFLVQNVVLEESIVSVIKGYYEFYNKLYGKESVRAFNLLKPHFIKDIKKINFIDSLDQNLILAISSVQAIDNNKDILLLYIFDDKDNFYGFSRFGFEGKELSVYEIVIFDEVEERIDIFRETVEFYESLALKSNCKSLGLEIPFEDTDYYQVVEEKGYDFSASDKESYNYNDHTGIVHKEITKDRSDDFGRTRTNKQD